MIDRRHVVLGVAVAASIATKRSMPPALFYGRTDLYVGSFVLDAKEPTRNWTVVTTVVLPAEAADHRSTSTSIVRADLSESSPAYPVRLSLSDCPDAVEETLFGTQSSGAVLAEASIHDLFADCVPLEPCTRTFCVQIENGDDKNVAEVDWSTWAIVESEDPVDEDDNSIPVPITITVEEIGP